MAKNGRIRVLHVITALPVGGTQIMLLKLLKHTTSRGFDAQVLSLTGPGPLSRKIEELGYPVRHLGLGRSPIQWINLWKLPATIRSFRPHILQTWLYHADLLGLVAGKLLSVPAIAWNIRCSYMGRDYSRGGRKFLLKVLARLSHIPDAIICNAAAGREWHTSLGYQSKNWVVIPNGFDTGTFRPSSHARSVLREELGIPIDSLVVGLVARFDPIKGQDVFLNAAVKVLQTREDVHFILVGEGCDRGNAELTNICNQSACPANIHLLGQRQDIEQITAALDIATCTSLGEGFPNSIGEAMASGVPCIATDVGDNRKICSNDAFVVPPGDDNALASVLARALSLEASERQALGLAGRRRIEDDFSLDSIVNRYERLYRNLA